MRDIAGVPQAVAKLANGYNWEDFGYKFLALVAMFCIHSSVNFTDKYKILLSLNSIRLQSLIRLGNPWHSTH